MKSVRRGLLLLILMILAGAGQVLAQEGQSPFEGKKVVGFGPSEGEKLQLARRLISSQRYQEAADILETLYQNSPDNDQIQNLLRACYDQSKQYSKAEILARRMLESHPGDSNLRLYLAELLVRMTRVPEALAEYDTASAAFDRAGKIEAIGYLRNLVHSLVNCDLDSVALARIDQARTRLGDPVLFAAERGSIYEKHQQYPEAVREYLRPLLIDSSLGAPQAESRLLALLDFEGSSSQAEQILKAAADSTSNIGIMGILSDHYMKTGDYSQAFAYCLRQDSLEGRSGLPLASFARSCQERHLWDQVVRVTDIILQQHPEAAFSADASLQKARALAELQRPQEAAEVYRGLADQSQNAQVRGNAIYGLGVLSSEYLHDYASALIYFDSVVQYYPRGQQYFMSRKSIPVCHLRLGHILEARASLAELSKGRLPDDLREEIAYMSGLVEFFDKKYDTAEIIFRKLMVDYPKGFFVNDALNLVLAIGDAKDARPTLDEYSSSCFATFRGALDSARICLLALADGQPPVMGDLALYDLTKLELNRADSAAAIVFIDRLDKEYPDSYYRPLGIKLKADVLARSGHDLKQAADLYRILLEKYSEYPFVREVRGKLRDLDSLVPAS